MTTINKDYHGNWNAKDYIDLGVTTEEGKMHLSISTSKRSNGGVVTYASVVYFQPDGCMTMMVFQDFNKVIMETKVRATEKAITSQHTEAMKLLPSVKEAVEKHYNLKFNLAA